ncbi:MAG: DegT/DnrJ/EryC1/StrS family aminotransferase [Anaerolineae bacterium]|nr:DegT/DnrJ/EryC1/StrS family aminotransferase [Anaerolineae bacterium]
MDRLAVDGGSPYRTAEFPRRTPFGDEEVELVTRAIRSQNLFWSGGTMVNEFEKEFAGLYGVRHATASSSGTAAIHVAVGTIDPEPGDEIITGPITDAGSIVPIVYQNAIPIFADINSDYCMDPEDVERKITPRTKAIMAVHLFGNPCDMDAMTDIARRHGIFLIEDCSQAHLTEYKGRLLGTFGDIAAFSLQQSKHMTTGDGGVTITNRDDLAGRMAGFRDKGWARRPGWGPRTYLFLAPNYRMTELQGAVGLAQLPKVRAVVERRNQLGDYLTSLIGDLPGLDPAPVTPGGKHSYWLYPLRVKEGTAEEFARALSAEGVPAGAGYIGQPIFLCMEALAGKKTFGASGHPFDGCHGGRQIQYTAGMTPRAEEELQHMVTLSLNENYTRADIEDMAGAIRKVAEGLARRRQ